MNLTKPVEKMTHDEIFELYRNQSLVPRFTDFLAKLEMVSTEQFGE